MLQSQPPGWEQQAGQSRQRLRQRPLAGAASCPHREQTLVGLSPRLHAPHPQPASGWNESCGRGRVVVEM